MKTLIVIGLSCACLALTPTTTGSLALDQPDPHVGDTITLTATVTNLPSSGGALTESYVGWIDLECEQGGIAVFDAYRYVYEGTTTVPFALNWAGGAAECSAYLFYTRISRNYTYKEPKRTKGNTLSAVFFTVAP